MRKGAKQIVMNWVAAKGFKRSPRHLTFELLEQRQMFSGDSLYFTKDGLAANDRLIKVDQLARGAGVINLSTQLGYQNVDAGDPGLNARVIDAAFVASERVVAVGGNLVQSYDGSDITNLFGAAWDPDGVPTAGVDAIAIGDFGALTDRLLISRETAPGANDVLVLSTAALNPGTSVAVAGGPTPGGIAHGLELGNFQPANPGNEVLIGFTDAAEDGGNGHQLFYP
ncbi:MAG: hypothetical protein L0Z53_01700, partial [Acidobacteriales bacterium]|nr:hypothetical protein [Terriglobales bacterium]